MYDDTEFWFNYTLRYNYVIELKTTVNNSTENTQL